MTITKRIGVLTFHRCINYGSYWQARCLVEGLRAMGHDAVLLDHDCPRINRQEWRCALHPELPERSSPGNRSLHARKTRRFLAALEELPRSRRFALAEPASAGCRDIVVVGSDEVWNLSHPWYGGHAIFYGKGLRADRLVSYAASFGNHCPRRGLPGTWAGSLAGFQTISVRDTNSASIIRETLGTDPDLVLDPCLQFPSCMDQAHEADTGPSYLAVYGHSFPRWFADAVRLYARTAGLRVASIGYRNEWADEQLIDAGPWLFAQFMAGASAVATNFFHGCVFSLLHAKPFVCVSSRYRANKITDLMRMVRAEGHLAHEGCGPRQISAILDRPIEAHIHRSIARLRRRSHAYLEQALA